MALARWDDSLQAIKHAPGLRELGRIADQGVVVGGLRRALFVLRRGELAHDRNDIEQTIERAAATEATTAGLVWTSYVLARAYGALKIGGWQPQGPDDGRQIGESYSDAVWRNLAAGLDRDPEFGNARRWLIHLLVAGGDRLLRDDQLAMLKREVSRNAPDPDAMLVWGRYLRTFRLYDSALRVLTRAVDLGGDASRLALERARTLRALHDTAGASAAYWYGLEHVTAAGRAMYRYDLAWIVGADSLAAFDRTSDAQLGAWMHRFWDERDAVAANRPGERLEEHLRRWVVAYARYRVRSPWRRAMYDRIDLFFDNDACLHLDRALYDAVWRLPPVHEDDLRADEWVLDHRGLSYLRFGEPLRRIGSHSASPGPEDFVAGPAADVPDSSAVWTPWALGKQAARLAETLGPPRQNAPRFAESWLYMIDGQASVLHFRDSYAIGMYDATTLSSFLPYSPSAWFALSSALAEYRAAGLRIAEGLPQKNGEKMPTCLGAIRAANAKSRSDADAGIRNDSHAPLYMHPWAQTIQMFALGDGRDGNGKALIAFALGGNRLVWERASDGSVVYSIAFHVAAWERATGQMIRVDTVRRFSRKAPLSSTERLVSTWEIPLPPGTWEIGVRANERSDSAGAYAFRRDITIDSGLTLSVSDIVLGLMGEPMWPATDHTGFPINAMARWPSGSAAELFFEVHGIPSGTMYRTTIVVRGLDGKNAVPIRIVTRDQSAGTLATVRRSLGLERLALGKYELSVTVQFGSQEATRKQIVTVVPSGTTDQ